MVGLSNDRGLLVSFRLDNLSWKHIGERCDRDPVRPSRKGEERQFPSSSSMPSEEVLRRADGPTCSLEGKSDVNFNALKLLERGKTTGYFGGLNFNPNPKSKPK